MSSGSNWNRWDLHVHTPSSIHHNYPGEQDDAWEAFISDLERLPPEFKVLGINDYLFVDGYERLRHEKKNNNRLGNIDLLLPVVELRLDKFAGTDGHLQRVNLHVIFDDLEPGLIRAQFLAALTRHLFVTPEYADDTQEWHATPTRDAIRDLGRMIISSVPDEQRGKFKDPLVEGFNNLNVSLDKIREVLQSHYFKGRHLLAVGKTEWSQIRWNSQSIAEKKTIINSASCVFTAADTVESYQRARDSLLEQKVNARLLDCSDAHWLSTSKDKDRVGNCLTWIKAEPTFLGLRHALFEFDKRVYVGPVPPKVAHANKHPSRYIQSIAIKPVDAESIEGWFDCRIELNPGMVAVVGNKGSGKSALLDTIGLLGNSYNEPYFSFLTKDKFRHPRKNLASHFSAEVTWRSGEVERKALSESVSRLQVERVKYLPQQYIEKLCNEMRGISSGGFDAELRAIVFSHVPAADRLGFDNVDDLLAFSTSNHEEEIQKLRDDVHQINVRIVQLEEASSAERRSRLEREQSRIQAEIAAHEALRPEEVARPLDDDQKAAGLSLELERATSRLAAIQDQIESSEARRVELARRAAVARRLHGHLVNLRTTFLDAKDEVAADLVEIGIDEPVEAIIRLELNLGPIEGFEQKVAEDVTSIDQQLEGLSDQLRLVAEQIQSLKAQVDEPQRRYVAYQEALREWEMTRAALIGTPESEGSLKQIVARLEEIEATPTRLKEAQAERQALVARIHQKILAITEIYRALYRPITEYLAEFNAESGSMPISFAAEVVESGLGDRLWTILNRQVRGSFSGLEESEARLNSLLQSYDFNQTQDVLDFVAEMDRQLRWDTREGVAQRQVSPSSQLRNGRSLVELYDVIFGLSYLKASYLLKFGEKSLDRLSPGERGLLLLIFYLLVDRSDLPLVVDQPEENLDNQTIYLTLVRAVTSAVKRRQVIVATHSANVAVVCDADQIIQAKRDPQTDEITYESGSLESPPTNAAVLDILEGTKPAFTNRREKYHA